MVIIINSDELLQYAIQNGILDLPNIKEQIEMNERKKYLETHKSKHSIWQGKDGRWRTWVPDENCRDGRKQIARKTRGALEASVVEHYIRTDKEYRRKGH